jgi:saccharopine dehydrogenase-like NADP-dependent oxidoreductase
MNVIVLGAAGVQGRAGIVYLLEQGDVSEILAVDIREGLLQEMAVRLGDKRLMTKYLDLTDYDASVKEFKGYDVVLNSALTLGYYVKTTRAAMEAGANYLDLTTKGERQAQKALDEEYKKKGLVCVQDMGVAPGFTNIMAVYLMDKLDKTDTIDYKMMTFDLVSPDEHTRPIHCPIPLSDLMYLYSKPTYIYEDEILKELEPRARPERFIFDEPIGARVIAGVAHSEPVCLSNSFPRRGIKRVSTKTSYGEDLDNKLVFLRDLGFGSRNPIDVSGQRVIPFDVLQILVDQLPPEQKRQPDFIADLVAVVTGEKDGKKVEYRMRASIPPSLHKKMKDKGCFGSYRAGVCAGAAAAIIGRGQVKIRGVVEPELAIPPEQYIRELVKFGFNIELSQKTLL